MQIFVYFSAKTDPETEIKVFGREKAEAKTKPECKFYNRPTLVNILLKISTHIIITVNSV